MFSVAPTASGVPVLSPRCRMLHPRALPEGRGPPELGGQCCRPTFSHVALQKMWFWFTPWVQRRAETPLQEAAPFGRRRGRGCLCCLPCPRPLPHRASPGAGWGASTAHAHSSQSRNLEVWDEGRVGLSRGLSPWLAGACLSSCHSLSWLCNKQILISQGRPVTNAYFFAHVTSWFWASCSRGLWVPTIVGLRLKKQLELGSCFPHDTGKRSVTKSHSVPRGGTRHMV